MKVLLGSITLLVVAAIVALSMGIHFGEETNIPGLASQKTLEVMEKEFPNPQGDLGKTQLVLKAPDNETLTSEAAQQEVASVVSPYDNHSLNADSTIGYATITYKVPGDEVTGESKDSVAEIAESLRDAGWQAELIGDGYVKMATSSPTEALGVLLALVLLMLVFRSILVPIKAVLGFILSLGATLGFVTYVVQDGHFQKLFGFYAEAPVFNFLPIIVVGVLFGLAMDYEVFLVSRMREEFKKSGDAKKSVLAGMHHSGGVVTAAGLIMVAVFTGFIWLRLWGWRSRSVFSLTPL